jgi:signal transduction histidine kinase
MGIPPHKVDLIFEKFTQADSSTTKTFGGTGLGLAITKSLVEIMAGTIRVESQEHSGSSFILEIPFDILLEN